jgi:hypothetical protein
MYGLGANQIPITPIYQPAKRILNNRTGRPWVKTKFAYSVNPIRGWDSNHSFLLRLMQGRLGENLINNPAADDLIRDLYIAVHLTPDPPDDMVFDKINSTSPEKGIGLIEIKIVENGFDSQ